MVGAGIAGSIPGYSAVKGGAIKNIGLETLHGTALGAFRGGISAGIASIVDGGSFDNGFMNGFIDGARAGLSQTALNFVTFGYAKSPISGSENGINKMEEVATELGISNGKFMPVYRSGGIVSQFLKWKGAGGITLGRNLIVRDNTISSTLEETYHYYQQNIYGTDRFYSRMLYEYKKYGWNGSYSQPGTLENNAVIAVGIYSIY